jgi:hypothetical protein
MVMLVHSMHTYSSATVLCRLRRSSYSSPALTSACAMLGTVRRRGGSGFWGTRGKEKKAREGAKRPSG